MTPKTTPKPPKALKAAGMALWRAIVSDLGDGWRLDQRELRFLTEACGCADNLADLETTIRSDGVTVRGSRGQVVLHPAVAEVRQLRLTQLRLLSAIEMVDPAVAERSATPASVRGRKASRARWAGQKGSV